MFMAIAFVKLPSLNCNERIVKLFMTATHLHDTVLTKLRLRVSVKFWLSLTVFVFNLLGSFRRFVIFQQDAGPAGDHLIGGFDQRFQRLPQHFAI